MTKWEEYSYYDLVVDNKAGVDDFITYIDDLESVFGEDNLRDLVNAIQGCGIEDRCRFFINSYNGVYGRIKNINDEIISNSIASVSFDTQRLNYIAGYSVLSSNELSGVFDGQQQIYIIKNTNDNINNVKQNTSAFLTGMDDYIISEHPDITDINKITIRIVDLDNSIDAAVWANRFLYDHEYDHESDFINYVIISQFGDALYVFNNNDKYRCINVNICPNVPTYASYIYNVEYFEDLTEIYKWNIENENEYISFIPNNTICYYIDLEKPNQNSLLPNSVFYNYEDSEVVDSDFLIGGINYLGGGDGSFNPDDEIFNSIVEKPNEEIVIRKYGEYSKLNIIVNTSNT